MCRSFSSLQEVWNQLSFLRDLLLECYDNTRRFGGFLILNYRVVVKGYIYSHVIFVPMCHLKHKRGTKNNVCCEY